MPKINYRHQHSLEQAEAQRRVEALVDEFSRKLMLKTRWEQGDRVSFSGRGVAGTVAMSPGQVVFDLDLNFLLSPFKSRIEQEIARAMQRALS